MTPNLLELLIAAALAVAFFFAVKSARKSRSLGPVFWKRWVNDAIAVTSGALLLLTALLACAGGPR